MTPPTVETERGRLPLDTSGRPITPSRLRRAMRLNIAVGIGGMAFMTVCGPLHIMQVFFKNHLGASASQLGLLVTLVRLAAAFHLVAMVVFSRLRTRRGFWAVCHVVHRLLGFVLAGVSLYVAEGGEKEVGVKIVLGAMAVSWALQSVSASGWWSWMADLVPEGVRGTFFGRRSAIIRGVMMVWFFLVTVLLDTLGQFNIFYVYAGVFAMGGVAGVLDIVVHTFIPEPQQDRSSPRFRWRDLLAPLAKRNFLVFALTFGVWRFSTDFFKPFIWPHVTAEGGVGAPQTWMGISMLITQLVAVATMAPWGLIMDRFGRKPVVLMGSLAPIAWVGYFFLTPTNYPYLLPPTALVAGVLEGAVMTGFQQLMLSLTPHRNRTTFVAWYWTVVNLVAAGGPWVGGILGDSFEGIRYGVGGLEVTGFHLVGLIALALVGFSILLLSRVREGREKPVGHVAATLFTPDILRTFLSIGTMSGAPTSGQTERALRALEGTSSHLALSDALPRLDDPDPAVREEAARALGRMGSTDAVEALVGRLCDPSSTIRPQAARALGQIGDSRAVPHLVECLSTPDETLQEACAQALGEIGGRESVGRLRRLMGEKRTERVRVSGAEAVSKHGVVEAAWEILPHMHRTENPVLRRQLAIAMGNLLGRPGEFYQYLTGEQSREGALLGRLFRSARRALTELRRTAADRPHETDPVRPLVAELDRVRGLVEGQSYRGAVEGLHQIIGRFVRLTTGVEGPDEFVMDHAFAHDAKLGLGLWFATEVRHRMGQTGDAELLQMDALLGVYFLSAYRPPAASPGTA